MKTLNEMLEIDSTLLNLPPNALPAGIDGDLVKSYILMECGECVPRYQSTETYKTMNTLFYKTHQKEFAHLLKVANADYSPIENTDRYTSISDTTSEDESGTNSKTRTEKSTGERDDSTTTTANGTNGNTRTYANGIEDTVSETGSSTGSETLTHNTTRTTGDNETLTHNTTRATQDSKTETQGTSINTTTEHQVSADNVATYAPESKDIVDTANGGSNSTQGTGSETLTGTDSTQKSGTDALTGTDDTDTSTSDSRTTTTSHTGEETTTDAGTTSQSGKSTGHTETSDNLTGTESGQDAREKTVTYEHTEHTHGNIGTVTNAAMMTEEVNDIILTGIINIYKMISVMYDDFMMIGVY